jgi:hypothetical protein
MYLALMTFTRGHIGTNLHRIQWIFPSEKRHILSQIRSTPLMTGLIGLGHLSDKPRFYRQYAPLLVYHAEWQKSDPSAKICLK